MIAGQNPRVSRRVFHPRTEWVHRETKEVGARELYDHQADSAENFNVSNRVENAETVAELEKLMAAGWEGSLEGIAK